MIGWKEVDTKMKNTATTSVSLPPETLTALNREVERSGKSRSLVVNDAIIAYLKEVNNG